MTVHLCSCGFADDDPAWFGGHQYQHPGHHAPGQPPRRDGRAAPARRSSGPRPGSAVWLPIQDHLTAIDAELARRGREREPGSSMPPGLPRRTASTPNGAGRNGTQGV